MSASEQLKDLGIVRSASGIYDAHPGYVVSKGNRAAGAILRAFRSRDPTVLWLAFRTYVLPLLSYGSPCWNFLLKRDTQALERVQRAFTKRLNGMRHLSYEDRLSVLSAPPLAVTREKADLIFVYKCLHNLIDVIPADIGLEWCGGGTRGAGVRLKQVRAPSRRVAAYFKFRVPSVWNALPTHILNSDSLSIFKKRLCAHFERVDEQ